MEELLRVGVVTSTHGIKGEVKVFPTTDDPKRFKKLKKCFIQGKRENYNLDVETVKFFKQFVIIKFKGYDTIEEVEKFKSRDILVDRENAVKCKPGEYFICDLIGQNVVTDEGMALGKITNVLETGANNVYEITAEDGRTILVPVIKECNIRHDIEKRVTTIHLLKGLLDIN